MLASTKDRNFTISSSISWLLFSAILLYTINAALPRLEMLLFSGRVPIPSVSLKALEVLSLCLYFLICREIKLIEASIIISVTFMAYLTFEMLYFYLDGKYPVEMLIFGYNTMYFFLIMSLLLSNFKSTITTSTANRIILGVSIPVLLLGIAQSLINKPLLSIHSIDGYFNVLVWNYYGQVRAFSLFEAPAYYATYLVFFGAFVLANMLSTQRLGSKIIYFALFVLVSYSEFLALNRTGIFAYLIVIPTVFGIYKRGYGKRALSVIMIMSFLMSVALVVAVPIISKTFNFVFAFKDQSMFERFTEWQYWFHYLLQNPNRLVFGTGLFQSAFFRYNKDVVIDNMFLAVLVQIGAIGLIFTVFIIYKIWSILVAKHIRSPSPTPVACLALLTVWPIFATFGTGLNIFPEYALLAFLVAPSLKRNRLSMDIVQNTKSYNKSHANL
ncbi:O-antigen ligase family protein [Acidithiobacillus thiooxidans]|uniref:O-antigen ligase family protein n=1 Tax=Acidithiobacillus thiooxidans TaxID=930 RepID=UPI00242B7F8B|nr:O-antigen ligase family protein [Acidithiobacillus thiooxidans]